MKYTSRIIALLLVMTTLICCFSGCGLIGEEEEVDQAALLGESVSAAVDAAGSVQASIFLDVKAHIGSTGTTGNHTASVESDISVLSTFAPYAMYSESYSRILVDSASTREDTEAYIVPAENSKDYLRYEYDAETDEWTVDTLSLAETSALSLKTCLMHDWTTFFRTARLEQEGAIRNNKACNMYSGLVDSSILQELINDGVFGSFLTSVEHLLKDEINCIVYIEQETNLPVQMIVNFAECFTVSDMVFDSAMITVDYADWGSTLEIAVPKKVSVVSSDPIGEFYASYYAWNLFLPYLQSATSTPGTQSGGNVSFTASWNTYQIRIDNGMTALPIVFEDLAKRGYAIDNSYVSNIVEPNMYVENVPVYKGRDLIYCVFYNDSTEPQPISDCKIGQFDISAGDQTENSISVYLPGEVSLGMTRESLLSAYGNATETIPSFSCDTYIWRTEGVENQSFLAEVSPVTNQVIRLQLTYIPVTGGKQ